MFIAFSISIVEWDFLGRITSNMQCIGKGRLTASQRQFRVECVKFRSGIAQRFLSEFSIFKANILSNSVYVRKGMCALFAQPFRHEAANLRKNSRAPLQASLAAACSFALGALMSLMVKAVLWSSVDTRA
jgi:hypothetical protein